MSSGRTGRVCSWYIRADCRRCVEISDSGRPRALGGNRNTGSAGGCCAGYGLSHERQVA